MSQENVEVVRRAWQAFISEGVEATLEGLDRGLSCSEEFPEMPESRRLRGHGTRLSESSRALHRDVERPCLGAAGVPLDAGENLVIRGRQIPWARLRASGAPPGRARNLALYEMRDGKVFPGRQSLHRRSSRPSKPPGCGSSG